MAASASVLVASDEPSLQETATKLLSADAHRCALVETTERAIEVLRTSAYDLLIADEGLPGNDRMRLIREAARLAPGMPVIIITGCPSLVSAVSAIELPVVAYLTKPPDAQQLRAHVETAIERALVHRAVGQSQRQMRDLCWRLENVESLFWQPPGKSSKQPLQLYVEATLANLGRAVCDLSRVAGAVFPGPEEQNEYALRAVGKSAAARGLLQHTVEVLEQTKGAFKSKQLAQLRRKVQVFLDEWGPDSAGPRENSAP